MASPDAAARPRIPRVVAGASLAALVAGMLFVAGRPLDTNDFWWHLKMGEVYATQGLWPPSDPFLHTAPPGPPEPHQWLFGIALHGLERGVGFQGLRVAHALAVAAILGLAFTTLRRQSRSGIAACAATCAFIALAWYRLFQLRPELVSIAASFALYRLLLEDEAPPSWPRVAASCGVLAVWVNCHAIFAVGPLLLLAALAGLAARAGLARRLPPEDPASPTGSRARRLAAALGLGLVATLANPRSLGQHLAFYTAASQGAIWKVQDEWARFDPFDATGYGGALDAAAWLGTDAMIALFLAAGAWSAARYWRRPSPAGLRAADPVLFTLGLASICAVLVSIRFLWMSLFPLLFLMRALRAGLDARPAARRPAAWALAAASVLLVVSQTRGEGLHAVAAALPRRPSEYLGTPYRERGFYVEGVRFLRETGVEGRLFNPYALGGFFGYWLAPRLRTFVDGSMNFPEEVGREYHRINAQLGTRPGETFLGTLDRRGVDLFFGVGVPRGPGGEATLYNAAHLERAPGWLLVFRAADHAIYLRDQPRNRENLRRIAAYYAAEAVPFDPRRGLDVGAVIRERPDWAVEHGLLPERHRLLRAASASRDPDVRFYGLVSLGRIYALIGAYREQIQVDRAAIELRPDAEGPRRRLVYALLRMDRPRAARVQAEALAALDSDDERSAAFVRAAREYAERREAGRRQARPIDAPLNELPLLTAYEGW